MDKKSSESATSTKDGSNALFLELLSNKIHEDERKKVELIRRNAQKDKRIRTRMDRLFFWLYTLAVDMTAWNQRKLQQLINTRNKYSETFVVHDSIRVFADLLQGDQLDVLKELQVVGAQKISENHLLISFGTYEDEITLDGVKKKVGNEGMLVSIEAILDHDAPFLKVGMDTWNRELDSKNS